MLGRSSLFSWVSEKAPNKIINSEISTVAALRLSTQLVNAVNSGLQTLFTT